MYIWRRENRPTGFQRIMPLKSSVSCSSVQGSFRRIWNSLSGLGCGFLGVEASPVVTPDGLDATRGGRPTFLLGGMLAEKFLQELSALRTTGQWHLVCPVVMDQVRKLRNTGKVAVYSVSAILRQDFWSLNRSGAEISHCKSCECWYELQK